MPLHNAIPLCDIKYVRDIFSSATFKYSTMAAINKTNTKLLCKDDSEIQKESKYLLYKETPNIDKNTSKLFYSETKEIDIEHNLFLDGESKNVNIQFGFKVSYESTRPIIKCLGSKDLNKGINTINKINDKELEKLRLREIYYQILKNCCRNESSSINILHSIELQKNEEASSINILNPVEIESIKFNDISITNCINLKCDEIRKEIDINNSMCLGLNDTKIISKENSPYAYERIFNDSFNKFYFGYFVENMNNLRLINKEIVKKYFYKYQVGDVYKSEANISINNVTSLLINVDRKNTKLLYRQILNYINKDGGGKFLYGDALVDIMKEYVTKRFYRDIIIPLSKSKDTHLLDRISLFNISINDTERYLDRLGIFDVFKNINRYMNRLNIADVFKIKESYANRIECVPVFKYIDRQLSRLNLINTFKDESRYLRKANVLEMFLNEPGIYINVVKRWWWLDETNPRDHLIVPNRDYAKMIDLLSNPNYEYLRYGHHPIEWGENFGIDWNIPPYAVSIEIMLDLVNIVTMIWKKNAQGWLSVSGKEAMQLFMELIYDWYTMSSSNPNQSYYRAYRWIRWEAEKVFFLNNVQHGLHAMEILVNNLIDYLRIHHFNVPPLWRNIKAMDKERNFNRIADNGDIIKDLDKIKGKRNYFIEIQNFEKKDIFRR